jgi:multimeric flavodoxin WrbA
MKKILVIYHSQQFGNTKILALALADGLRDNGGEVFMVNTNEGRVSAEEFVAADAVAIGTPDYYSYPAGTIKTFFDDIYLWDKAGKPVKGKPAVLFMTHGGGGRAKQSLEGFADRFFQRVGETVSSGRPVSEEAKSRCLDLGKKLLQKLSLS